MTDTPPRHPQRQRFAGLTRPHPSLSDPEEALRARLIAIVTLLLPLSVLGVIAIMALTRPSILDDTDTVSFYGFSLILLVVYFINRTGRVRLSVAIILVSATLTATAAPFLPNSAAQVILVGVVPVVLAAMIASPLTALWIAAIILSVSFILTRTPLMGGVLYGDFYFDSLLVTIIIDAIIIGHAVFLRHLENVRRQQLELINQQLRESEVSLERRVIERTVELDHANQAKSWYLATMSHEIRTPLNAIINFTQFVSSGLYGEVNAKQADALNKATDSSRFLLSLINDVLDLSKIESGMLDLHRADDVELAAQLAEIHAVALGLLQEKPVSAQVEVADDLPPVPGDKRRIHQIILNLVSNACKFTEEGTVTLRAYPEGDRVIVAVADTGPGIPPDQHENVFEPYKQIKQSDDLAGTGLGLPIALRLAESMGGRLWLESTPGAGATFYLALPVD